MQILILLILVPTLTYTSVIIDSFSYNTRISPNQYDQLRKEFLIEQFNRSLGSTLELSEDELRANDIIMKFKWEELGQGFLDPEKFSLTHHIFEVLDKINQSKLFQLIQAMPKGGVLHAHDMALLNTNQLVNFTYLPHLWMLGDVKKSVPKFLFSREKPKPLQDFENDWQLVADIRERISDYDSYLKMHLSLYTLDPFHDYRDINVVWKKFQSLFGAVGPIMTYDKVWKEYYRQALASFKDDGVQYLEFRGVLPEVYTLDQEKFTPDQVVKMYIDVLDEFMLDHGEIFIGSKFIYAPNRLVNEKKLDDYMEVLLRLRKQYPNFVVGFDLVGQEDRGEPLKMFAHRLLELPNDINFFFHAGETNWNGMSTDENLVIIHF